MRSRCTPNPRSGTYTRAGESPVLCQGPEGPVPARFILLAGDTPRPTAQLDSREEAVSRDSEPPQHTRSRSRLFGEGILLRLFELELSLFNKLFSLASMRHFWPSRRASTHDRRRPNKSRRQCTHTTDPRTVQSVPNVQRPPRPPDILRIYCRFSRYLEIYDSPSTPPHSSVSFASAHPPRTRSRTRPQVHRANDSATSGSSPRCEGSRQQPASGPTHRPTS